MSKACIYIRVSTGNQSNGIDSQKKALVSHLRSNGITDFSIFEDEAISGSKKSRPALNKMMSEVKAGNVSAVYVYSFSRFARSTKHLLEALQEFQALDVDFISVTESIDTSSPMGKLVFTFVSALAEFERALISERVTNGLKAAKARGTTLGAPKKRNSELIRELHQQGLSYRRISQLADCSLWSVGEEIKVWRLESGFSRQNKVSG